MITYEPENSPFKNIYCDIVHRCNMECANCYLPFRHYPDLPKEKVIFNSWKDALVAVREFDSKDKKTLMISGSQGSGKSTLSLQIKKYFKKYYSKNVVILSIDDFYLSSHQRKLLAKKYKTNLFETRGVPGTHNLKLLSQTIRNLKNNKFPLFLPVFDKVADNKKKYQRKVMVLRFNKF